MDQTRMDDETLIAALRSDVEDAVSFIESDIGPARAQATRFYHAEPFGDEEEGRSQIVMPIVRDTVRATLPSLMRIFTGGQRVLEFVGTNATSAEQADLMTETVQYVFMRQNPGFSILWDSFKDALVRKVGWIKWYWDDAVEVTGKTFEGVGEEQLLLLTEMLEPHEDLEVVEASITGEEPGTPDSLDPMGSMVPGEPARPVYSYKVRILSRKRKGKVRVCAVPPEEIIVDRHATSIDTARLIGHRCLKSRGELVAMGIADELLDGAGSGTGSGGLLETNEELLARQPTSILKATAHETEDQQLFLYCEMFYRIDRDGDGISELRRIVTVGDSFSLVHDDYADEVQLAGLCPDPEPHVIFGLSQADNTLDLQLIGSHITRDMLDSLKASIFPRTEYVEGQVNADDVMNTEIGAAIRTRAPGMINTLAVPFVGQQAMPILEWMEGVREQRTGTSRNAAGIDPKALQSTSQIAVNAAVTGSQQQVELIARIFAETGLKRVFRGILRLLVQNQRVPLSVTINGQPQPVNPKDWDVDTEVEVLTGLGTGSNDAKIQTLEGVAQKQMGAIERMGPDNPLAGFDHLYNTLTRILELQGIRDTHRYWRNPKTFEPPPAEPPAPSPEEVIATAQMEIEAGKLDLAQLKTILEDDLKRDELEADIALRAAEINAKYKTSVDTAAIKAMMERARIEAQAAQGAAGLVAQREIEEMRIAAQPSAAAVDKPRKVTRNVKRDAQGRVSGVEERPEPTVRTLVPVRDESGRVVSIEERSE